MPDVQLQLFGAIRRTGKRIGASGAITQQQFHILSREIAQTFGCRQLQAHHRHVRCRIADRGDSAGHLAHRNVGHCRYRAAVEAQVAACIAAAGKQEALLTLLSPQGGGLVRPLLPASLGGPCLAGTAGTIAAPVGQHHALAQCRLKQRLGCLCAEPAPCWRDFHGETHA